AAGVLAAAVGFAAHRAGTASQGAAEKPAATQLVDAPKPESPKARTDAERLDRLGDPLPPGALARFGTLRLVQGGRAYHMALSPDGKLLATGDEHGRVRVWDTSSGKELRVFDGKEFIGAVAFAPAPDGLRLAAGTNTGRLRVW